MNKKQINSLYSVAALGLSCAGVIFVLISALSEVKPAWAVPAALVCVALSNLFMIIQNLSNR